MDFKLNDTERKVMKVLWEKGDTTAKQISDILKEECSWNINTTYTIIKKCIQKGIVERMEPGFLCHAKMSQEEARQRETESFLNKVYEGAVDKLFATLLSSEKITCEQRKQLKDLINTIE